MKLSGELICSYYQEYDNDLCLVRSSEGIGEVFALRKVLGGGLAFKSWVMILATISAFTALPSALFIWAGDSGRYLSFSSP